MIKIVIFDFDGTIADTEQWTLDIYNELATKYGYKTYTIREMEEMKKMHLSKLLTVPDIPYSKVFILLKEGQSILKKNINNVRAFTEDLKKILMQIRELTGTIGIISSNTKKNIRRFCKNKDIEMDFIISSPLFTKEIKINRIINKYRVKPEEILYVGDEVRDIESSQKAGVKIASATWGYNDKELLSESNPDYLIDSISELIEILHKENRKN